MKFAIFKSLESMKTSSPHATQLFKHQHINANNVNKAAVNNNELNCNINTLHYVFKALVLCICLTGCLWQITSILHLYFNYPTTVFVYSETMDKLFLPGITLCNRNRSVVRIFCDSNFSVIHIILPLVNAMKNCFSLQDNDVKVTGL